jgi:hypothetical protein
MNVPPRKNETLTRAEARERYGILRPVDEYARFRRLVESKKGERDMKLVGPELSDSIELLGPTHQLAKVA